MTKFRVYLFVFVALLSVMSLQALAQNVGDVVFQNPLDTTARGAILYPFLAVQGSGGFTTGMSVSNVAAQLLPTSGATANVAPLYLPATDRDGYVIFVFVNRDGTKIIVDSRTLGVFGTNSGFQAGGSLKAGATFSAFLDQIFTAAGVTPAGGLFIGYGIAIHTFWQGTGVGNVVSPQSDLNVSYVALDIR
ncbi:MAG: hypothetical protein ACR2L2_14130 [Acidobacteriota bacterium]